MFEGTLVESRGLAGTGTKRWTALGSVTLQVGVAGLLVLLPMLRPEVLPLLSTSPRLMLPVAPRVPPPPVHVEHTQAASSAAAPATSAAVPSAAPVAQVRGSIPDFHGSETGPVPDAIVGLHMGNGSVGPLGTLASVGSGPQVTVAPARVAGPVRISSGVSDGMLLREIRPVYPRIAVAAHVEGTVVMEAMISKAGTIESLRAVSGPVMLRQAALDAAAEARYRPYRLNGEATEVSTTITVVFRLGS